MAHSTRITFVIPLLLVSIFSIVITLIAHINILWILVLLSSVLLVFIAFVFPGGIWLFASILILIGTLLPYNYHLIRYYYPHYGGAWPHPVFSPTYFFVLFSFLLILLFYNRNLKKILYINLSAVFLSWLIFSLFSFIISFMSADSISASFFEFIRMIVALYIYFFVIFMIDDQEKVKKLYISLCIILIFESLIAFLQYSRILPLDLFLGEEPLPVQLGYITQIFRRVRGTFRDPNIFGKFVTLYIPILFSSSLINKGKLKILSIVALVVSSVALLMTFSRSAIVGAILSIAFTLFFINKFAYQYMPSKKIILSGVGIIIISISAGIMFLAQILYLRFITFGLLAVAGRFAQFENAIHIIKNHFFSGVGLNNYFFRMMLEDYTGVSAATPRFIVHNIYLLYFAETGIFGFILFIIFITTIFHENIKTLKIKALHPMSITIIIGGISGVISFLLQGLLDWGFRTINMYHLLFLLGLMHAIKSNSGKQIFNEPNEPKFPHKR